MFVKRNIPLSIILKFGYQNLLIFMSWSIILVAIFYTLLLFKINFFLAIPFAPVSIMGIAVSFYLGFKNNQSYDRFWEARIIWGGLVNLSRHWANQVLNYLNSNSSLSAKEVEVIKKDLIYRQLAFLNALRLQLRKPSTFSSEYKGSVKEYQLHSTEQMDWKEQVAPFLCHGEFLELSNKQNMPTHILAKQASHIKQLFEKQGFLTDLARIDLMATIKDLYAEQGRCERIKNTPLPRQYAYFSKVFVWIFVLLLPLALIPEFAKMGYYMVVWVVPLSTLISWVFITMEVVGDSSEDPFENFINDVPMTTICRNIEIDLKELLNETDIPPRILPIDGILM